MSKEDDISQIEQTTSAAIKAANGNSNAAAGNALTCHLNANSNSSSSASNDLINCLENVNQQSNDPLDDRSDGILSKLPNSSISNCQINRRHISEAANGQTKEEKSAEESK